MNFEQAVLTEFPEVTDTITRQQALFVKEKYNLKFPHHVINPNNNVGRGIFKFSATLPLESVQPQKPKETDAELDQRITETYATLDKLVEAVASDANINSLIVSGAPGFGKSYEVNKVLNKLNGGEFGFVFHRGYLRATHLYRLLWENRLPGQTVVLDDVDTIFSDETSLNMLKAALELKDCRTIGWGSEKEFIDQDGEVIPRYFQYQGNVIFLTNLAFSDLSAGSNRYAAHLNALDSRSLVLDLKIKTKREFMAKIKQTVAAGMLREKGLYDDESAAILNFMENNIDRLKELSLRMCEKLAALYLMDPKSWEMMARTVCLK